MKRYRFIYTICVLLVFINISCSDFWDVEDTNPSYTNEGFYTNENAIREGATGVYSNLYMQVVGELAHTTIFDFYTGLALERNENTTIGAGGGLNADNSDILKFWSQLYTNVARANAGPCVKSVLLLSVNRFMGGCAFLYRTSHFRSV